MLVYIRWWRLRILTVSAAVIKYFEDRGMDVPADKNIAEFILETAAKGGRNRDGKKINWNQEWLDSEENKALHAEIGRIKDERSKAKSIDVDTHHEFASPVMLQTTQLTKRLFLQYWRSPEYMYGKLFVSGKSGSLRYQCSKLTWCSYCGHLQWLYILATRQHGD